MAHEMGPSKSHKGHRKGHASRNGHFVHALCVGECLPWHPPTGSHSGNLENMAFTIVFFGQGQLQHAIFVLGQGARLVNVCI